MSKLNFDIKRFFKTSFQDSKFERSFENVPIEAHPLYIKEKAASLVI